MCEIDAWRYLQSLVNILAFIWELSNEEDGAPVSPSIPKEECLSYDH